MYPFTDLSPLGVPFVDQVLSGTCNQKSLNCETKGNSLPGKPLPTTRNTCCYSETHTGIHSLGFPTWLFNIQLQNAPKFPSMDALTPNSLSSSLLVAHAKKITV
jgi:hypothetical protein